MAFILKGEIMGTRADFYILKDKKMIWIGSIAWDGYPEGIDSNILKTKNKEEFLTKVEEFLKDRDDSTYPKDGWPWPWKDSNTTDYAYIFRDNKVIASCFGSFFNPLKDIKIKETVIFPDMTNKKNVTYGKRSGLIIFGI